jgi:hypothetical protein
MTLVTDGTRLALKLPAPLEAYEHEDGSIAIWDPKRKKHCVGLTWFSTRENVAAALCNLGYEGADFEWEPRMLNPPAPTKFKVGDTGGWKLSLAEYYDAETDAMHYGFRVVLSSGDMHQVIIMEHEPDVSIPKALEQLASRLRMRLDRPDAPRTD